MIVVPEATPLTRPVLLTVATVGSLDDQVTSVVKSWVVPSVIVPNAVYCTVSSVYALVCCGDSTSVTSSAGVTVTVDEALPPLRLAVTVACPTALAATGKSAKSAPAGILTLSGTETMSGALETSDTAVTALGARDTLTRSVPGVPLGVVNVAGVTLVTTGGGGTTS